MEVEKIKSLLEKVKSGEIEVNDALQSLRTLPFEDLGFSKIDHHRQLRTGFPEVIFCEGKTDEQVAKISKSILDAGHPLLATRATPSMFKAVKSLHPDARYNELGRTISIVQSEIETKPGILVVSAGTSDLPVAEEAAETANIMGSPTRTTLRRRCRRIAQTPQQSRKTTQCACHYCNCWYGRRIAQCYRRIGRLSCNCCPHKCRLRSEFRWTRSTTWHVKQLCLWSHSCKH